MQPAAETDQTLSIERKLKLHEARETIIGRLAANLPTSINLDSFLKVVVAELGQMMEVDRCDIIKLSPEGELRISHEWRASETVPSSLDARIPVDAATLAQHLDVRKPIRLDDTSAPELDHKVRFFAKSLGTRSLLVVPVVLDNEVLGLIGLHHTRTIRHWADEEVAFLVSIAMQLAIGYQYTRIYTDKKREAETTKALLEIANALNARSDFGEVTSAVLERALALVGADYCALGVLDAGEKRLSLAAFQAAPHARTDNVRGLIEAHGQARGIRRAMELALSVADTQTSVMIQGESGTGKELLANLIHFNSGRENQPYIKLNCGAIPETLLESELFGHEKGAFTDARARRHGRFEDAGGGTLFLDEVGEMSLSAQVRLLRVLQDGEFARVGGNEVLKADVRVIAASNVDLEKATESGTFRRDLYYRLSVFPIGLPPLRERPQDIHPLVIHFIEHYKQKTGRFISGISKDALQALITYDWLGNVRELENAIERAVIIASGRQIELEDLPESISRIALQEQDRIKVERARAASEGRTTTFEVTVPSSMDEIERQAIEATLDYTKGDKTHAARALGIGRKTLYRKLDQYNGDRNSTD